VPKQRWHETGEKNMTEENKLLITETGDRQAKRTSPEADSMVQSPPLPQPLWQDLLDLAHSSETLAKGSLLLEKGADPRGLFLLETGMLAVDLPSGSRVNLPATSIVGEMSWLSGEPIRATVSCEDSSRIHWIQADYLWAWINNNPTKGRLLLESLSALAMKRLQGQFHHKTYLALIAHDGRKPALLEMAQRHRQMLSSRPLLTTAHTGETLTEHLGLTISRRVSSGPLGGDQEVGSLVVAGLVEAVVFFPDPLSNQPHSADVAALLRVCDVCGVPMATNAGTADLMLTALTHRSARQFL